MPPGCRWVASSGTRHAAEYSSRLSQQFTIFMRRNRSSIILIVWRRACGNDTYYGVLSLKGIGKEISKMILYVCEIMYLQRVEISREMIIFMEIFYVIKNYYYFHETLKFWLIQVLILCFFFFRVLRAFQKKSCKSFTRGIKGCYKLSFSHQIVSFELCNFGNFTFISLPVFIIKSIRYMKLNIQNYIVTRDKII